jgi:hypothetical protein
MIRRGKNGVESFCLILTFVLAIQMPWFNAQLPSERNQNSLKFRKYLRRSNIYSPYINLDLFFHYKIQRLVIWCHILAMTFTIGINSSSAKLKIFNYIYNLICILAILSEIQLNWNSFVAPSSLSIIKFIILYFSCFMNLELNIFILLYYV